MSDLAVVLLLLAWLIGPVLIVLALMWAGKRADDRELRRLEALWQLPSRERVR